MEKTHRLLVGKQRQSHVESSIEAPQNVKAAVLLYDYNSGYMPPTCMSDSVYPLQCYSPRYGSDSVVLCLMNKNIWSKCNGAMFTPQKKILTSDVNMDKVEGPCGWVREAWYRKTQNFPGMGSFVNLTQSRVTWGSESLPQEHLSNNRQGTSPLCCGRAFRPFSQ